MCNYIYIHLHIYKDLYSVLTFINCVECARDQQIQQFFSFSSLSVSIGSYQGVQMPWKVIGDWTRVLVLPIDLLL